MGLAVAVGLQLAVLNIAAIMLIPTVVMRAAGASESLGAARGRPRAADGRLRGVHLGQYYGVAEGGAALLATLVVITAVVPLLLSWRLAQVQRIVTPTVAGTVIMLIPVTVLPAVGDLLVSVPDGSPAAAAPLSALATVVVITGLTLTAPGAWRLWAPVIGVGAGSLVGGWFGVYDVSRVAAAAWIDFPRGRWPGFDFSFGPAFWALLPAFLLVAVIAAVRTMSSAVISSHYGMLFPELLAGFAGGLLHNGMNAGGYSAILMTLFVALTGSRRSRLRTTRFDRSVLAEVATFLRGFAAKNGWDEATAQRLEAAAEETMLTLLREAGGAGQARRRLLLSAHRESGSAVLEFVVGPGEHNLQDRLALLGEPSDGGPGEEAAIEREVSLRLLRHLAASVRHQQYHDTDVVTVRVRTPAPSSPTSAGGPRGTRG